MEKLGLPLGPRRKLLKAIAGLSAETTAVSTRAGSFPRSAEAERRQLTVLFCDLVGSTELSTRLDPEDLGEVIRRYQSNCAEVLGRWGGQIARFVGDGTLAFFGYPRAHEDDAERAVRAGLELVGAVSHGRTADDAPVAVRVSIATGLVMVGDLISDRVVQEYAIIGETPNLAARLQAVAGTGEVVIAPGTRRLVGGLFELAQLGAQHLKGFVIRAGLEGGGRSADRGAFRGAARDPAHSFDRP